MCVNLKKQPLHPLQLLVDLPGKWRIRECQRETETQNQRESNRDSFKAFCGCVIESWSSCACLTHWVMVGCLGSHTHTHSHTLSAGLTYQRCPTPYIPLHYPPLPFPSTPHLFRSLSGILLLLSRSFSSALQHLHHTLHLPVPPAVKVHRPSTILLSMSHV